MERRKKFQFEARWGKAHSEQKGKGRDEYIPRDGNEVRYNRRWKRRDPSQKESTNATTRIAPLYAVNFGMTLII